MLIAYLFDNRRPDPRVSAILQTADDLLFAKGVRFSREEQRAFFAAATGNHTTTARHSPFFLERSPAPTRRVNMC